MGKSEIDWSYSEYVTNAFMMDTTDGRRDKSDCEFVLRTKKRREERREPEPRGAIIVTPPGITYDSRQTTATLRRENSTFSSTPSDGNPAQTHAI